MFRFFYIFFFLLLTAGVTSSCKTGESDNHHTVNTDLIQNPVSANGQEKNTGLPVIAFDKTEHDFGTIIEGEIVEYTFNFTNTGGSDLILTKVSASCGCTIPKYDTKPVAPGEKGQIVVSFNSENRRGNQSKTIKVLSNAQPSLAELTITSNIVY